MVNIGYVFKMIKIMFFFLLVSLNLHANEMFIAPKSSLDSLPLVDDSVYLSLEKAIVFELSLFSLGEVSGKKYNYESVSYLSKDYKPNIWGRPALSGFSDSGFRTMFVRVGDIFIVDSSCRLVLSKVLKDYANKVIFLKNLNDSELGIDVLRDSALSAIIALLKMDLKDKVWVDLGAGSGILSLIAEKRGAKLSILVEKESKIQSEENIKLNGIISNKYMFFLEDLKKYKNFAESLQGVLQNENVVLGMNVGYFMDYNITNITGIALLNELISCGKNINIEKVIFGGHNPKLVSNFSSRWLTNYEEHDFLRYLGFNPNALCLNINFISDDSKFHGYEDKFISFTEKSTDGNLQALDFIPVKREEFIMSALGFLVSDSISLERKGSKALTIVYEKDFNIKKSNYTLISA